jgi:hypothetical protein
LSEVLSAHEPICSRFNLPRHSPWSAYTQPSTGSAASSAAHEQLHAPRKQPNVVGAHQRSGTARPISKQDEAARIKLAKDFLRKYDGKPLPPRPAPREGKEEVGAGNDNVLLPAPHFVDVDPSDSNPHHFPYSRPGDGETERGVGRLLPVLYGMIGMFTVIAVCVYCKKDTPARKNVAPVDARTSGMQTGKRKGKIMLARRR